jgi:hypothetical protein
MKSYEKYRGGKLFVEADLTERSLYSSHFKLIGARWNSKASGGRMGWLVSEDKMDELVALLDELKSNQEQIVQLKETRGVKIKTMKSNPKSRKNQHKYHRAVSDDDDDLNEDELEVVNYCRSYQKQEITTPVGSDEEENVYQVGLNVETVG